VASTWRVSRFGRFESKDAESRIWELSEGSSTNRAGLARAEALNADGAEPCFPDAKVGDRHARHDPGSIGELEGGRGKVGVDVVDSQHGELALVLELVFDGGPDAR
jgi:hypothetical protein